MTNLLEHHEYFQEHFSEFYERKVCKKNKGIFNYKHSLGEETAQSIFYLLSGEVSLEMQNKNTESIFYSLIGPNQVFGLEVMLDKHHQKKIISYEAIAISDVEYLVIDKEFFLSHSYLIPTTYHQLLTSILNRQFLLEESYKMVTKPPLVKVCNALLNLIENLGLSKHSSEGIRFPDFVTQVFISRYVMSSETRVISVFKQLEKEQIIQRKPLIVFDYKSLKHYVNKQNMYT
ncbi:conserved hypothetical protein [Carnobacterium maltaromaticum]|uniref:Crp/Fnr family transcriptional regulator n=1 Tax=Carnobacterium maltaromaticum TaxID=2751 RepID=UPI00191B98A0|nr:Crp/Fnr family transcriptional regulator [Carnobacterium maltaromaticum]CAD5896736.1 conserved hypothetical protein [Carnobacterium maltaromaticum]